MKAIKPVYDVFKEAGIQFDECSLCRRFPVTTPTAKRATYSPAIQQLDPRSLLQQRRLQERGLDPEQPPKTWQDLADYAAN